MNSESNFDSVCQLADDPGFIGQALRALPEREWLAEADRWPEPWEFLLKIPGMSKDSQMLFRAAQSQRTAMRRFTEIARRAGSIEHSWGAVALCFNGERAARFRSFG